MQPTSDPVPPAAGTARRSRFSRRLVAMVAFLLFAAGCGGGDAGESPALAAAGADIRYGPPTAVGHGTARTYLIMDGNAPVEVGVAFGEDLLHALPADGAPGGMTMPDGHSTFEYVLEMPADNPTPFQHVTFDWNPAGHEPPGIYDRPHFDVHFYTISNEERQAINPGDPEFMARAGRPPAAEHVPAGFIEPGLGAVPLMGVHWLDPTSPELHPENPAPFTRTLIYGSWDGRMIFIEPMVSTEYLATRPDERIPLPVASRYEPAGYYPGEYLVRWDDAASEYRIGLSDLRMR
jgi:hypothetical protein